MIATVFLHFWHYFYVPAAGPWYSGNVWGNVFVIAVVAPLGWLWSKSKFWPLRPIKHGIDGLHKRVDELHARHDQNEANHAHLLERIEALHDKLDEK